MPTTALPTTEYIDMIMQPVLSEKQQQQLLTRILVLCYLKRKYSMCHKFICTVVNSKPEITQIFGCDALQPVRSVLTFQLIRLLHMMATELVNMVAIELVKCGSSVCDKVNIEQGI